MKKSMIAAFSLSPAVEVQAALAAVLGENAEAELRLCRTADAIRVRGYALSMEINRSPQPSPAGGEGALFHRDCDFIAP